jgi:FixJ family two-component response regulator
MTPTVFIVDDDEGIRKATTRLLTAAGFMVCAYPSGDRLLAELPSNTPGCIILDVCMPGLNGLDLQVALGDREDRLPIIFLTGHAAVPDTVRAIRGGAVDFLTKPIDPALLLEAVDRALVQDAHDRTIREHRQHLRERYEKLTDRERQVFERLIGGQLNKQVAADLQITERTIKLHRARILQKLNVDSMASLARFAVELGIQPRQPAP